MDITSSYCVRIEKAGRRLFGPTVQIYRDAVSFLIGVFDAEWNTLSAIENQQERFNCAEHLVHTTKKNSAKYDFDAAFPKMPSYLRRAAIRSALGSVSSYCTSLALWIRNGSSGKPPKLTADRCTMPVFYNDQMYRPGDAEDTAYLKLYRNGDWVWVCVKLRRTDVRYLRRYWSHEKASAPTLEYHYGKYQLRFAYTEKVTLTDKEPEERLVCAVDLGLNTDAVCVIMDAAGTVAERKFIDFPAEKDQLWTVLGRIKKHQKQHGSRSVKGLWRFAKHLNEELAKKIGTAIADFAFAHHADVIVFEHLDFRGKRRGGSKAQKLSMWRKSDIQKIAGHRAHRLGMRYSRICPWNTSRLAFDGSGRLTRNPQNHALATFKSGKQYNADLSAAYNIGARYFVREIIKALPATTGSRLLAKVPDAGRRTSVTLDTLRQVHRALAYPGVILLSFLTGTLSVPAALGHC